MVLPDASNSTTANKKSPVYSGFCFVDFSSKSCRESHMLGAYQVLPEEAQVSKTGPELRHIPTSADVFADEGTGVLIWNGCMRITLESLRSDYSQNPVITEERVVIGRLVMPVDAAVRMAELILQQASKAKEDVQLPPSNSLQ